MGFELSYETYMCGYDKASKDLDNTIEENERYKNDVENEILALVLSDPAKVRNQKKKSKKDKGFCDDDDFSYLNNPQYLLKLWGELKEQWEEAYGTLIRCRDAKYAIERGTRTVWLCKDCLQEISFEYNRETYNYELKCPKCGKVYNSPDEDPCAAEDGKEQVLPLVATIRTWNEG